MACTFDGFFFTFHYIFFLHFTFFLRFIVTFFYTFTMSSIEINKEVNKGGPPFSDIWDYMTKGAKQSKGHYSATCNYCKNFWKHGKPFILRGHLANICKKCSNSVTMYYAELVGKELGNKTVEEEENLSSDTETPPTKKEKKEELMK